MTKVLYPGTFDPVTIGHLEIIKRISMIFDQVIVGVAVDSIKNTLFSVEDRVSMIQDNIFQSNITVESFKGLLVNFAKQKKVTVIVRGLRALADFEYEFQMWYINHKLCSEIETLFLPAGETGHFISSSLVKEIARLKGNLNNLVPQNVMHKLLLIYQ